MNNLYITTINGLGGAAYISQRKTADIALTMGFKELPVFHYMADSDSEEELNGRIAGILSGVECGDIVILQLPTWNFIRFERTLVKKLREKAGVKVIIFVHDVTPVMFKSEEFLMNDFIALYNSADVLILPTEAMVGLLRTKGLINDKIITQKLWDHVTDLEFGRPQFMRLVSFCGSPERFPFIEKWNYDFPMNVYGYPKNIEYPASLSMKGHVSDSQLMAELSKGGFGLCWSENESTQKEREYSRMNASYKLSTYLAVGIPIVANKDIAARDFIKKHHLGVLVDSLDEAYQVMNTMTEEEYYGYVDSISRYNVLLRKGFFTKKIIADSMHLLFE